MDKLISISGDVAAVVGILLCVVTGTARLLGTYAIAGLGTMALFTAGVGLIFDEEDVDPFERLREGTGQGVTGEGRGNGQGGTAVGGDVGEG